jgi:hypothetical protein
MTKSKLKRSLPKFAWPFTLFSLIFRLEKTRGYKLGERLLRPVMVRVARNPKKIRTRRPTQTTGT